MSAPVKHTCPDIDRTITLLKDIQKEANYGMKCHDKTSDDYQRYKDIEWFIDDIVGTLEDLRSSNHELRSWGEELDKEIENSAEYISRLEEQLSQKEAITK